ncbi:MAG TPA: retropepsin-like aspartic protease [Terracidiphilus sp.]|jgi:hypothetical protein|nr:retropepsin-like aspartic protease [Terracidiphilus sp.]
MTNIHSKFLVITVLGPLLIALAGAESALALSGNRAVPGLDMKQWRRGPVITIPFTLIHGIPFIKLSINGKKDELFMLDSGCERTILNSDEAPRLKIRLSPKPVGHAVGLGDSAGQEMFAARSVQLKFGGKAIAKGDFFATSLFKDCGLTGVRIAGVIGYDVLRAHPTVIDYPNGRFMIFTKGSFAPHLDKHIQALDVDRAAAYPVIAAAVSVEGRDYGPARVVVDTGADAGFMFYARFAANHTVGESGDWNVGKNCAIGGFGSLMHGLPGSINVGQEKIALPDVAYMLNKEGIAQSELYDGLIGGPVLDKWSIVFDVANGKIYLIDSDPMNKP